MRRITFYFLIALLAFGIGSFIAVNAYWNFSSLIAIVETSTDKIVEQTSKASVSKTKFTCEDEAVKTVWDKLRKDKNFIDDAYSVIEARGINNCQELFDRYSVNLNDDESNEIVLKGGYILFCGSGGDCRTWIVSKVQNEYSIIFDGKASESAEGIRSLQKTSHNFKDIKVKLNNHWESDNIGFFKFDGKQYRIKKCFVDVNSGYEIAPVINETRDEKLSPVKLENCL